MSANKDTVAGTITVALIVSLICSIFVSVAAVKLKPVQDWNEALDKKTNILQAAGLWNESMEAKDIENVYGQRVNEKVVELASGKYSEAVDIETFDAYKAAKDPQLGRMLTAEEDIAGVRKISKFAKVYEVNDGGALSMVVLPIHGKGLWSTLYGYLAIQKDANTIKGIGFYKHGETPGLGGEVDNPNWKKLWDGKKISDQEGEIKIEVIKGKVDSNTSHPEYKVDGLSGATITGRGVSHLVRFWLSDKGFAKYLEKVKQLS